jgi:hypothetical protein
MIKNCFINTIVTCELIIIAPVKIQDFLLEVLKISLYNAVSNTKFLSLVVFGVLLTLNMRFYLPL